MPGETKYTLGLDNTNDIVLDKPQVSGRHLEITDTGEKVLIKDLNSTNGTFKHGKRILQTSLQKNERIKIADHEIDFDWIRTKIKERNKEKNNDYSEEFKKLKDVYDDYLKDIAYLKKNFNPLCI